MISHDHPRFSDTTYRPFACDWSSSAPAETCAICGDEEYDMRETHMGLLCSSCTRPCAICEDWLLTDATVFDSARHEMHKACAEDEGVDLIITPAQCIALAEYSDLGGAA